MYPNINHFTSTHFLFSILPKSSVPMLMQMQVSTPNIDFKSGEWINSNTTKCGKQRYYSCLTVTHLILEYDSTFTVNIPWMDPCVCREENGAAGEAMKDDLQQVELLAMVVGNENSTRASKVTWHCEISSVFHNVWNVWRLR